MVPAEMEMRVTVQLVLNVTRMMFADFLVRPTNHCIFKQSDVFHILVGGSCSDGNEGNCPLGSTCDVDDFCKLNGKNQSYPRMMSLYNFQ